MSTVALVTEISERCMRSLETLWRQGKTVLLVSPQMPQERVKALCESLQACELIDPQIDNSVEASCWDPQDMRDEKGIATYMATSGTTNCPKLAAHSFSNHVFSALGSSEHLALGPEDSWLLNLPLYHVGGIAILWRCALSKAKVVFSWEEDFTHVSLVPTQLYRLMKEESSLQKLRKAKVILVGGAPLSLALADKARQEGLRVHHTYGSTEMSSQITTMLGSLKEEELSSGRLLPYREMKIDEEQGIWVQGKTLFQGYVQNGKLVLPVDDEGWFRTGDRGFWDEQGSLHVLGRCDRMVISGGENVHPEQVEAELLKLPSVLEARVSAEEDLEWGQRLVAQVRLMEEASITEQEIKTLLRETLPAHSVPKTICVLA